MQSKIMLSCLVASLCVTPANAGSLGTIKKSSGKKAPAADNKPVLLGESQPMPWQAEPQFQNNISPNAGQVTAPLIGSQPESVPAVAPQAIVPDWAYKPYNATGKESKAAPAFEPVSSAPVAAASTRTIPNGYVEAGGNFHTLNKGFDDWYGGYLKGQIQTDPDNSFNAVVLNQHEFGDSGTYAAIGNTHRFDDDWYSTVSVGGATDAVFLPRYRIDAFLNRKLLPNRELVATVGLGYYKSHSQYSDRSIFLGAAYYFPAPWVIQGGVRFNQSNPGSVNSVSEFVALTYGREGEQLITGRYGFGKEAYQIIGPGNVLSEFYSHSASLEWRQWLEDGWGFNVLGESYFSGNYDRNGATFGVFKEF